MTTTSIHGLLYLDDRRSCSKQHYESITLEASRRFTGHVLASARSLSTPLFGTVLVGRRITVTKQNKRKRPFWGYSKDRYEGISAYSALGLVDHDVERWMYCVFWCYADERGIPFSCYVWTGCFLVRFWDYGWHRECVLGFLYPSLRLEMIWLLVCS